MRRMCIGPACERPAFRAGLLCRGHRRQQERGEPLAPFPPPRIERLTEAAMAYANATTDEGFAAAEAALLAAAEG